MLAGCLESLCNQNISRDQYEIIVVDNNSKDNTSQIVSDFIHFGNLIYVLETSPGLSYARNRGLKEAKGEYIAYIDDDARADKKWLGTALQVLEHRDIDCLGGPYHPFYSISKPSWFMDRYEIRSLGDMPKFLRKGEYISGSNMIWRKSSLMSIGGFDVGAGVVGNQLRLGEETGAIDKLWITANNPKLFFSPELIIYHWVPEFKMSVTYRLKRRFAEGQYQSSSTEPIFLATRIKNALVTGFTLIKVFIRFFLKYKDHSHWQNWVVEDGGYVARVFGKMLGYLGFYPHIEHRNE